MSTMNNNSSSYPRNDRQGGSSYSPNREEGGEARGDQKGPVRRQFFRRRKTCPFSGANGLKIDYKDVRLLYKFVSERGKMMPSRISAVSIKKQRDLSQAVKRARFLALMPYIAE